jgi:hypothetical protein
MAFRLLVSYKNLKATVSVPSSQASLSKSEPKTVTTFVEASAESQYILASTLQYVNLSAVNVRLDPDSKNLYFTTENNSPNVVSVTMQEEHAVTFGKTLADTATLSEAIAKAVAFPLTSENISLSEDLDILIEFLRDFSDSTSLSETSSFVFETVKTDTVNISESQAFAFTTTKSDNLSLSEALVYAYAQSKSDSISIAETLDYFLDYFIPADLFSVDEELTLDTGLGKTDTVSISEAYASEFQPVKADSISISEDFSRVVAFSRAFSDSFTLDDLASVEDPLQTDVDLDKANVTFLSEELLYTFSKPLSDSFSVLENAAILSNLPQSDSVSISEALISAFNLPKTDSVGISESHAYSFSTSASDSATITESLTIKFIQSRTINSAALNTNALN